jgi:hypothetical protein
MNKNVEVAASCVVNYTLNIFLLSLHQFHLFERREKVSCFNGSPSHAFLCNSLFLSCCISKR